MDWLKTLELDLWWRALIAVGLVLAGAALAAKDRGVLIVAFGLIAIGFGEWLNRPKCGHMLPGMIWSTWYMRMPCISGILLDVAGALLIAFGAWKVLIA